MLELKCQENARAIAQQMANGGSGSDVTVTQVLTSGTKIATIAVGDDSTDLYCETVVDTLSGLSDIDISSPSDGETLVYDNESSKWVNGDLSAEHCMLAPTQNVKDQLVTKSSDTSITGVVADVINGILIIRVENIILSTGADTWVTLGTLPEGYRPADSIFGVASNNNGLNALINVNSNGEVKIRAHQTDATYGYYGEVITRFI